MTASSGDARPRGSKAPSGAASPGARPPPTRRPDPDPILSRATSPPGPNRLWVADLSYLRCWEGLVFFAFVFDAYAAAWSAGSSLATCAPRSSWTRCGWRSAQRGPGPTSRLFHHSDRGSQYTSIDYTQTLADHGVLASVGSVGDAYDNALAESFVDSFKTELIADRVWRSRSPTRARHRRVHRLVQRRRLHQALGDLPPSEFERLSQPSTLEISLS